MVINYLGWFVAGNFLCAFLILWFFLSYRELKKYRDIFQAIGEDFQHHRMLSMQERGGENDASSQRILESKGIAYSESAREYNKILEKPYNRPVAIILGFKHSEEG